METLPDIPRILTVVAEGLACVLYLVLCRPVTRRPAMIASLAGFAVLLPLHLIADILPLGYWIPTMVMAVATMFAVLWRGNTESTLRTGLYLTIRAFILAEFTASFAWQLHLFFFDQRADYLFLPSLSLITAVYLACFGGAYLIERRHFSSDLLQPVKGSELTISLIIGVLTFALSNISFVTTDTPFSGRISADIFYIRSLVGLGGYAALCTQGYQAAKSRADAELAQLDSLLQRQHAQYLLSKAQMDQIRVIYHDLKHQLALVRSEMDATQSSKHLDSLERQVSKLGIGYRTGNAVLDTILTSKAQICHSRRIDLRVVADGDALAHISTMDLASLIGNALDNATEAASRLDTPDERLITVAIFRRAGFVVIKVENCFDGHLIYRDGNLVTRKKDHARHGLGVRSIKQIAARNGGATSIEADEKWFKLTILLPAAPDESAT